MAILQVHIKKDAIFHKWLFEITCTYFIFLRDAQAFLSGLMSILSFYIMESAYDKIYTKSLQEFIVC